MFAELREARFEVVLIPAPEPKHTGHQVRALQYANPRWYSEFTNLYRNCRGIGEKRMKRPRTYIKKETTLRALEQIGKGKTEGVYIKRLLHFINSRVAERIRRESFVEQETVENISGVYIPF